MKAAGMKKNEAKNCLWYGTVLSIWNNCLLLKILTIFIYFAMAQAKAKKKKTQLKYFPSSINEL